MAFETGNTMRIRQTALPRTSSQRWSRVASILIVLASLALLATAFNRHFYSKSSSHVLLFVVLFVLSVAIALHIRFLLLAWREQRETARTLDATERKYQSVFDHALDGILILDDHGICLEANPAALDLFRIDPGKLVGGPIGKFYAGSGDFEKAWKRFRDRGYDHGETQFLRDDGQKVIVEFTAKADFLPGRHVFILRDVSERRQAETALRESEERFQQMASNIQEIFWMLDPATKHAIYVNQAYETITGRPLESLREDPTSYQTLIHPEDRVRVLSRLEEAAETGQVDEEFRIIRPDEPIRWIWARGFPVRDGEGVVRHLVGTAQDISARKSAEEQVARNLDIALSARAEADAFRKTTLALTQNLSMDYVLDTLLESLLSLIPCESAQVLLVEADTRIFVARKAPHCGPNEQTATPLLTLDAKEHPVLMRLLTTRESLLIPDTAAEAEVVTLGDISGLRSWLCVPLLASGHVLGFLTLGDSRTQAFTEEHLRLAKSLAIPAAVAIQNARLYERAEIYSAELGRRLADLEMTQQALHLAEESQTLSEERFSKIFRSSPIPFSISTLDEDRVVDVNEAFERRYGYSREELIGRSVSECGIWGDESDRQQLLNDILRKGSVRNHVTKIRKVSGEVVDTIFSARAIDLDGRACVLAVSDDSPERSLIPGGTTHNTARAH